MLNFDDASSFTSSCTTPTRSSSSYTTYSTSSIRRSLFDDQTHFRVLPNSSKRSSASCWKIFGFPAKANGNDTNKFEIISGFVSCKSCFDTYKYIDSSTANLYAHRCYRNQSSDQTSITSFICSPRSRCSSSKNVLKKKNDLKELCTKWIADSMRPFQIVADPGFKRNVQTCFDIGKMTIKNIVEVVLFI